ncbi:MAG: peptidylprolyl isomerase [Kiritimatiellia bacterium]
MGAVKVNGVEIFEEAVEAEFERLKPDYERYVAENGAEPDENQLRDWALENLIEKELLTQEAQRTQEEPAEDKLMEYMARNAALLDEGLSDEEKCAVCVRDLKIRTLVKSVRKNVSPPSEDEMRREYEKKTEFFTRPEALKLSHISRVPQPGFEKSQAFMDLLSLRKKIENSELSWADALRQSDTYSHDFGMFDVLIRGILSPETDEKLFSLESGDVSDVIELEGGTLHIFKIMDRHDSELLPFENVRDDISTMLFNETAERALNDMIDGLKSNADIAR